MDIQGKNIVLTGAASGIGRALLERLARVECRIYAVDLSLEAMQRVVGELPAPRAQVTAYACDVGQQANVDRLFADAVGAMGGIDVFIANAGFAYYEQLETPDWGRLEAIYRVNVFSPIYAAAKMRALNGAKPYTMVITASAQAKLAIPGYAVYAGTKAALDRFADAYRFELSRDAHLMMVYPIGTRTGFFKASGAPVTFPTQPPEAVADAMMRGLARGSRTVYPSLTFRVLWVVSRVLPLVFVPILWIDHQRLKRRAGGKHG